MANRTKIALAFTLVWIAAGVVYGATHAQEINSLQPNELGDALAGFFAPLAFLWIIIAYLQQGDELRQNTEALRLQEQELAAHVDEARRQSEFMERRLELEREARAREAQKAKSAIQPELVSKGGSGNAERWKMRIANEGGGPARDITVTLDGEEITMGKNEYFAPGDKVEVIVPRDQGAGVMRFDYLDRDGDRREATYQYTGHCELRPTLPGD